MAVPFLAGVFPLLTPVFAAIAVIYSRILYKKGKILPHYNLRYIGLDPIKGLFLR